MRDNPFQQGDLDGLCGAYAIVNTIQIAIPRLFTNDLATEMMRKCLGALPAVRFPDVLFDGTDFDDLKGMAKKAFGWFNDEFFPKKDFSMDAIDIYKQGRVEKIDDLWNRFDGWVAEDGPCVSYRWNGSAF